jgi:hypothetical protein
MVPRTANIHSQGIRGFHSNGSSWNGMVICETCGLISWGIRLSMCALGMLDHERAYQIEVVRF